MPSGHYRYAVASMSSFINGWRTTASIAQIVWSLACALALHPLWRLIAVKEVIAVKEANQPRWALSARMTVFKSL